MDRATIVKIYTIQTLYIHGAMSYSSNFIMQINVA